MPGAGAGGSGEVLWVSGFRPAARVSSRALVCDDPVLGHGH